MSEPTRTTVRHVVQCGMVPPPLPNPAAAETRVCANGTVTESALEDRCLCVLEALKDLQQLSERDSQRVERRGIGLSVSLYTNHFKIRTALKLDLAVVAADWLCSRHGLSRAVWMIVPDRGHGRVELEGTRGRRRHCRPLSGHQETDGTAAGTN